MKKPVVVIGDGWAALAAVAELVLAEKNVCWIAGSGARIISPLPSLENGPGPALWNQIASGFGIDLGQEQTGSFVREYKNKSFRKPAWSLSPTSEIRLETLREILWSPETRIACAFEQRFDLTLGEIEEKIRTRLLSGDFKNLKRIEGVPMSGFKAEKNQVQTVVLSSGEEILCDEVYYADRWSLVPKLTGLPKGISFVRKTEPLGVLQATFTHPIPMAVGVSEGFFAPLHKEAGEEIERHVWGYFYSEGRKSVWTICLSAEEIEDNHAISKKLRRMKNALDKMFTGESWLPEGNPDFMSTIQDEQVRFEEALLFAAGEIPTTPLSIPQMQGMYFLTDGFGPSSAVTQVSYLFGNSERPNTQGKSVDLTDSVSL